MATTTKDKFWVATRGAAPLWTKIAKSEGLTRNAWMSAQIATAYDLLGADKKRNIAISDYALNDWIHAVCTLAAAPHIEQDQVE